MQFAKNADFFCLDYFFSLNYCKNNIFFIILQVGKYQPETHKITTMQKYIIHSLLFCFIAFVCTNVSATTQYRTQSFKSDIKTLTCRLVTEDGVVQLERPYLTLDDANRLEIAFDQLSHLSHHYTYSVIHCNADWTESDLMSSEYLKGFTSLDIDDYEFSETTQQIYTHYRFQFPNEDMTPLVSGNYCIKIYEDYNTDNIIATACFSIVEPSVGITADIHSHTAIELSGRYQQVDFDIDFRDYYVQDPSQIIVVVQQNGRRDNMVFNPKPSFIESNRLKYINNKALIFEGGNEYRTFDTYSEYVVGTGIDRIVFDRNDYHVLLYPSDNLAKDAHYMSVDDVNGQYVINAEKAGDESDYRADYMYVHFLLPAAEPWFDGSLYINGDFTYNELNFNNRMQYSFEDKAYYYTAYLKQGGYNFQYLFVPKGETKATTFRTEGSFWQTRNEYTIYVYHRPFGSRYDKLIGLIRN